MIKKLLCLCLCVAGLASCKNEVEVLEVPQSDIISNSPIAETAIKFKNDMEGGKTRANSTDCVVKSIKKMQKGLASTRATDESVDIYSVAFDQDMGSVVIAQVNDSYVPLAYFMNEQDLDIDECLTDTLSDLGFLMGYLAEVGLNCDLVEHQTRAAGDAEEIIERVEPKCHVAWSQDVDPYNRYCLNKKGERTKAGCAAIAGAQALTVLQPDNEPLINSWYWVTVPRPSEYAQDQIAKLIYYVGKSVGMNYAEGRSEVKHSKLRKFLLDTYKLNGYDLKDYDAERAIDVLRTEHGVIVISGYRAVHGWGPWEHNVDGHAFIGDGYVKYNTDDNYYLHLNYGWGSINRNVYVLSSKKKWKVKEARDVYGVIFTHDLRYCSLTYTFEKNW